MSSKTKHSDDVITIMEITKGVMVFNIVGTTPLILHRMSEKALHELLLPRGRKTAADKASTLKHDPYTEYRASAYTSSKETNPTLLTFLASAFKRSLSDAALDLPGAKKAQIGRLTYVEGDYINIYGIPKMLMSVVRSADMNKTPDIRTRMIVPEWACRIEISYVMPIMRDQAVANLMAAAGISIGVGDWRPQKGAGNYGQFRLASSDDAEFLSITKTGGRDAQKSAVEIPECYDDETADLLAWFDAESNRRGFEVVSGGKK